MKALPKLEKLKLQGCDRVDDEAIRALAALPALREVDLKGTAVTEKAGCAAGRQAEDPDLFRPLGRKAANFRNN